MMRVALIAATLALGGCASLQPAQMQLPSSLAGQSAEPVLGIDGWTHGRFRFAGYSGGYERSETRLRFFNADRRAAHADFTIEGPMLSGMVDARCRMRERALTLGSASFVTSPMAYRCDFLVDGRSFPARFELQESADGIGGMLAQHERRGEIALGGEILAFRSVHGVKGSPLTTETPIGYLFYRDGEPVGAIELNGTPRLISAPALDPGVKRTMAIASMALALLWDPADSQL
ncbi:VV20781 family protein [Sphingomicrobium lutaoense]|uniref:Lipoprotein n=1 Tax=Sphingomicrobium lutaoense TaxID=515949 RepID=A0A839Z124_9SPHN|nr:hypothetical protein [Sphingomicrobium lutaoense]MBB3764258.1 hypothetical protein [Sphingomicrobium lutaoense]